MPVSLQTRKDEWRGLWLGLLGVVIFAITLPMTRLATGTAAAPQLTPVFVTFGRAAGAGLLSLLYLVAVRAARPSGRQWAELGFTALGVVIGFPLFLAFALRLVPGSHASVITGVLPLATAAVGALVLRQRPSVGFWLCAGAGTALVIAFAALQSSGGLQLADGLLLVAVLSAACGYVSGARLSKAMPAEQVICWVLALSLPVTLPVAWVHWPAQPVAASAWWGFGYVTLFSMWLGFFAWYRGLALGGTVRVSQVQLLQPFLSLLLCVPLLGEPLDAATVGFALAVIAVVGVGKRMPIGQAGDAR
ncbi:DMT family transporter [Ideonella sp. BN130291]|uniref:DMT family transporter n=1 Tax=Ideonella sp. BN130291 TaxID=3112940 RepID=UPI002E25E022|nr:DMT family transporter [Ideonella sp. BN130291]